MDNKDQQRITLHIDCHTIALNVNRKEEPFYRLAAERVNAIYKRYMELYPHFTADKLWAHVALEIAVDLQRDVRDKDLQPVLKKIGELNDKVVQVLRKDEK
ncbi:MAG: cell division protein ZapA [Paludibacter sp.]|nr:cell division protein ZapA [Bacteroidales bacterium]MCM1068387.1 cell division protein ZapA [Prevotella sp.]MCM1354536.1 cell division protein ZapA [Bacteroides sp.]MCM1443453.1 cell division protein ZapA [Muribaculum sp.]MCM1482646.1 cell division protein ZapA [Paludibacter sp.]